MGFLFWKCPKDYAVLETRCFQTVSCDQSVFVEVHQNMQSGHEAVYQQQYEFPGSRNVFESDNIEVFMQL